MHALEAFDSLYRSGSFVGFGQLTRSSSVSSHNVFTRAADQVSNTLKWMQDFSHAFISLVARHLDIRLCCNTSRCWTRSGPCCTATCLLIGTLSAC